MTNFIIAIILLAIALAAISVRKTYYFIPEKELKRRAQQHDPEAAQLYQVVAYGSSLEIILWIVIALSSGIGFVLLARVAPIWLSLGAVVLLLWLAFSWLPASRTGWLGSRLALLVAPTLVWLLHNAYPVLRRLASLLHRYAAPAHTGLFERSDLLDVIEQQHAQPDNRITVEELEIAHRALSFGDYQVSDLLIPAEHIKTVAADDTVGPILIDELHKAGHAMVPVAEGKKQKQVFVGALRTQGLGLQSHGRVRDLMDPAVYYLHEDDSLSEALHAFYATNFPLFIVVDNQEHYVGVLTIEAILHQLLGHIPGEDHEHFANLAAVASHHHRPTANGNHEADVSELEKTPDESVPEVVE